MGEERGGRGMSEWATDHSAAIHNVTRAEFVGLRCYDFTSRSGPHSLTHVLFLRLERQHIGVGREEVMLYQDLAMLNVSRGSWFPNSFEVRYLWDRVAAVGGLGGNRSKHPTGLSEWFNFWLRTNDCLCSTRGTKLVLRCCTTPKMTTITTA